MSVSLPTGLVPDNAPTGIDALTTNRKARYVYELLARDMSSLGTLDGVRGSSLHESAAGTLKRGGNIAVTDRGQDVNWLASRIKVSYEVENYGAWGIGVYVPSSAEEFWDGAIRRWDFQALDAATVLVEDEVAATYSLPADANIIDAVRDLIEDAGENAGALTESDKTLAAPRAWESSTPRLTIINSLLDTANYLSLFTDGDGNYRAEPYVRPASRPVRWEFLDGTNCVYRPLLSRKRDQYNIPNRVIAKTQGTGDTPGLVSVADNTDPNSEWSQTTLGRVKSRTIEVEAADQATLDAIARRRLIALTTPQSTIVIDALPVPVSVNDAVRFRREPMGVDSRHVVSRIEMPTRPTGLARYTLTQVVDV